MKPHSKDIAVDNFYRQNAAGATWRRIKTLRDGGVNMSAEVTKEETKCESSDEDCIKIKEFQGAKDLLMGTKPAKYIIINKKRK